MEKAQYAIMRFAKYKGPEIGNIEAHNERTKEKYASNPDVDTSRSKYNFHLVKPPGKYRAESERQIAAAGCRTRKDSIRMIETLFTASPEFFKGKKRAEIRVFFEEALHFLEQHQSKETIISAVVHMDEKTPHMHLCFVPLTEDGRLSAKDIMGNKKKLTWWQDEFWKHMVKKFPDLERGESASLTGGMDMTSAFAAAGYDLQAFDASDMAYGTDRLLSDVMTATGPSIASNLYTTENEALLARSTSWSRNRISNGMNTIVEEAGKKIGFFSLASIGNSAQTKELTAADLALAASEQVAALQAQGADAILCIAGPDTDISGIYADLADLGVTAVLDAGATANSTTKANGIAVVAAGSGWDSVGCLNLTFAADGSMTAEPASMSAADLKSARGSYTTAQQTAYDSAFTSLQSLADGDEDVRSQTLFTFEANESADKTISFANYAAALYLAYADGDRANCPQDAADLTVTALAGGITELDFGDVTRGALCDAVPAGQRLVLARTTSAAIGALIDTGTVTRTYEESLTAFEPTDGDALVVTDTAMLEALEQAGGSYTILRDYGDVFWDIRMNINDVTNNFANPFTLPEAPQRGAGRK